MTAQEMFEARAKGIAVLSASIEAMSQQLAKTDRINWGHVGSLGHFEQLLTEVHDQMAECVEHWS